MKNFIALKSTFVHVPRSSLERRNKNLKSHFLSNCRFKIRQIEFSFVLFIPNTKNNSAFFRHLWSKLQLKLRTSSIHSINDKKTSKNVSSRFPFISIYFHSLFSNRKITCHFLNDKTSLKREKSRPWVSKNERFPCKNEQNLV